MKYKPKKENIKKIEVYLNRLLLTKTNKDGKLCNK
jgi:hypothetical protein